MTRTIAVVLAALAAAGCVSSPSPSGSLAPINFGPSPSVTHFEIGTTVYIAGFLVRIDEATASLDAKGGPVKVVAAIENGGPDASLDVPIVLVAGGATFELAHGIDLPFQSSGVTDRVELQFEVTGRGSVDDGEIRVGRPADHVAVIPLRPDPARAVTLEPRYAPVEVIRRAGTLSVSLHQLSVRWDLPDWHDELPLATEALTLYYDVSYVGGFAGGIAFTGDNVQLQLPDGTLVSPRADGHSQSIVLIKRHGWAPDLQSRFEIPNGTSGKLALVIRDGSAKTSIPFTLGP